MEKTITVTGKNMELATQAAMAQLGLDRDSIQVELVAREKSGFFGIGSSPCIIKVTYEAPDPVEPKKTALGSASRSKPKAKPEAPKAEPPKVEVPKAEAPKAEAPKAEPKKAREPKPQTPKAPKAPKEPKVYTPAAPGSTEEKVEKFIKGLLEHMGSEAQPHAVMEGDTCNVELVGEDLGYLIGRRGDTLDAIQHLSNYSINRGIEGHIRINVDAEEYRAKREDSLTRYAQKKAQQVLKAHRRTTLEPMNAYERHVIHAALQDMDRITTYSVGSEPNRRVVIEYQR